MRFIYITGDPLRAVVAQDAGVHCVMVDLEILGKEARQGRLNTVISRHTLEDALVVRRVLTTAELMIRVNPLHEGTGDEVDACVAIGCDRLMLPMFTTAREADSFVRLVDGRAGVHLLLETAPALARLHDIVALDGVDEIHVGLNDLHLDLRLKFMFEILAGGLMDHIASQCHAAGRRFGFGGVARLGGTGAVPAELILSEHRRLGSQAVILSRDYNRVFEAGAAGRDGFVAAVAAVAQRWRELAHAGQFELDMARVELQRRVRDLLA